MRNRLIALLLAVFIPLQAFADTKTVMKSKLVGLGMSSELSNYIANTLSDGNFAIDNADYLKWRNAAGTGTVSAIAVDASDDLVLQTTAAGDKVKLYPEGDGNRFFSFGAASDTAHTFTFGDASTTALQTLFIGNASTASNDDTQLQMCGGGAYSSSRGACIGLNGDEFTGDGDMTLTTGSTGNSDVKIKLFGTGSALSIDNSSDVPMWDIVETSGALRNRTGGSDLSLSLTGTTVAIQEATAGSACSGTLTLNGATPVVTSTTCATAGSRIFLTRTSIDADTSGDMAVTALNAGVSFSVTSEANDTATVNWFIVHEAA